MTAATGGIRAIRGQKQFEFRNSNFEIFLLPLRPPTREMPLQPFGQRREHDSGERDDDDPHKQRVGCERLPAVGKQEANTFDSSKHLANDTSDPPHRYSLT